MPSAVVGLLLVFVSLCIGVTARGQQPLAYGPLVPNKNINAALKAAKVIPDVLGDFDPAVSIVLSYPSSHKDVDLGNKIKPRAVGSAPDLYIDVITPSATQTLKPNVTYVLVLTDPGATSRSDPVKAQMCHWIVANISLPKSSPRIGRHHLGFHLNKGLVSVEDNIFEIESYLPPNPPPKTGYHRYVFVLLQTPVGKEQRLKKPAERPHWGYRTVGAGVREWAGENNLEVVGANFFYSQNQKQ